jgi:hypothetical protein
VWAESARTMAGLGCRLAALAASPELFANAALDPPGAARCEVAILHAAVGPAGLVGLAARMAFDSVLLAAVVTKERLVDDLPSRQRMAVEQWLATLPITVAVSPVRAAREGERRLGALAAALPGFVSPYTEIVLGLFAPSERFRLEMAAHRPVSLDPVFGLPIGRFATASESRHQGSVLISRYSPEWHDKPAASIASLLSWVAELEISAEASIAIQRVVGSDGVARYVVALPGIRHLGMTSDPQDLLGAVAAMAATSTGYTRCVRQALDAVGAPQGAEVLLVGHSQGGLVAMDLAGDPAFNGGRVRVTQVVAAGAPISSKPVVAGSGTRVLSIENVHDIVTHLDAVESATAHQSVDRLTYQFAADEHNVVRNHDVSLYAGRMQALADSPNPLLAGVQAGLRPYLSGTATTALFTLRDDPLRSELP